MPTCELCRRSFPDDLADTDAVQRHHLRPEERATSPVAVLCRPCHDQVHALFTNAELRADYDTVESLRGADRLVGYLEWIRGTAKLSVETRTSDRVRRER